MTKQEFWVLIHRVLDVIHELSITKATDGCIWFNLNTGMKSHLEIALVDERCVYRGRYDAEGEINSFDELVLIITQCRHGREYGNPDWLNLIAQY